MTFWLHVGLRCNQFYAPVEKFGIANIRIRPNSNNAEKAHKCLLSVQIWHSR